MLRFDIIYLTREPKARLSLASGCDSKLRSNVYLYQREDVTFLH
nr:MAG TPA: hypothetical protein [Caudoviricetes sp.]DAT90037.1 MAG TPA: hypothetical protein [Bacteriophage sp.]